MLIVIHLQARYQPLGVTIVDWDMVVDWWVWTIFLFHCHCLHYFPLLYLIAEDNQMLLSMAASGTISNACAPFHFNNNGCLLTPVVLHQQQAHTPNRWHPPPLITLPPLATSLLSLVGCGAASCCTTASRLQMPLPLRLLCLPVSLPHVLWHCCRLSLDPSCSLVGCWLLRATVVPRPSPTPTTWAAV